MTSSVWNLRNLVTVTAKPAPLPLNERCRGKPRRQHADRMGLPAYLALGSKGFLLMPQGPCLITGMALPARAGGSLAPSRSLLTSTGLTALCVAFTSPSHPCTWRGKAPSDRPQDAEGAGLSGRDSVAQGSGSFQCSAHTQHKSLKMHPQEGLHISVKPPEIRNSKMSKQSPREPPADWKARQGDRTESFGTPMC